MEKKLNSPQPFIHHAKSLLWRQFPQVSDQSMPQGCHKHIYRRAALILICILPAISGCVIPSKSSGFKPVKSAALLPAGIPHQVNVSLSGPASLAFQANEIFSRGLLDMGFEIVDVGLEQGKFVGSVTWERSTTWTDTHLDLRFVDATGKTIWSASAHDPRVLSWSMAPETSIIHTTHSALKTLQKDLAELK